MHHSDIWHSRPSEVERPTFHCLLVCPLVGIAICCYPHPGYSLPASQSSQTLGSEYPAMLSSTSEDKACFLPKRPPCCWGLSPASETNWKLTTESMTRPGGSLNLLSLTAGPGCFHHSRWTASPPTARPPPCANMLVVR